MHKGHRQRGGCERRGFEQRAPRQVSIFHFDLARTYAARPAGSGTPPYAVTRAARKDFVSGRAGGGGSHDFDVQQLDCVRPSAAAPALSHLPFGFNTKLFKPCQPEIGPGGQSRSTQYAGAVALYRGRKFRRRPSPADPFVQMSGSPIISGDGIGPAAVAPEHVSEIGAAERAVFRLVKTIAAPDIGRRGGGDLHWSLWAVRFGAPHLRIAAMARLCAVHPISDAGENAARRRELRSASDGED